MFGLPSEVVTEILPCMVVLEGDEFVRSLLIFGVVAFFASRGCKSFIGLVTSLEVFTIEAIWSLNRVIRSSLSAELSDDSTSTWQNMLTSILAMRMFSALGLSNRSLVKATVRISSSAAPSFPRVVTLPLRSALSSLDSCCVGSSHFIFAKALLTFPQFRGHLVKRLPPSLRTRLGSHSRGLSGGAADYRTPQCTQRYPVSRRHGWHSADGTRARA